MKSYKKLLTLLTLLAMIALSGESLYSQHMVNNTGSRVKNAGTIRFINNTGEYRNAAAADAAMGVGYNGEFLVASSGTIEFNGTTNVFAGGAPIGQDDVTRINGWVVYSNGGAGQTVDPGTWYTNLGMKGASTKDFGAGTYNVDHIYTVVAASGTRNYNTSQFKYDGILAEDQTVFAESGLAAATNAYATLMFLNAGIKTLTTSETNNAVTDINIDATATYIVKGTQNALGTCTVTTAAGGNLDVWGGATPATDGWFRTNAGAGTLAGNVFINSGGTYITDGAGVQTFSGPVKVGDSYPAGAITNTSGSLTLASGDMTFATGSSLNLTNLAGHIVNGTGRLLLFQGTADFEVNPAWNATDTATTRSNMEFHVNSTTEYNGTDLIEATNKNYPYGNLTVSSAAIVEIETQTMPFVAGNFSLSGNDLEADADANASNGSSEGLAMLDPTKTMTFGNNLEIVGDLRRYTNNTSTTMTFNNNATLLGISDIPASVSWAQLGIWKNSAPAASDYNVGFDVKRRTLFKVNQSATDWKAYLRLGYQEATELPGGAGATAEFRNSLRWRKYVLPANASTKVTTGISAFHHITHDVGSTFAYVELQGFTTGEYDADLSETVPSGDELFLRGGPTWFITINNGRWSNPGTWDEGIQPGPNDLCLVRHTVWAGFVNQLDNFTTNETVHLATNFATNVSNLASYIQIYNELAAPYRGSLIFGESDGTGGEPATTHEVNPAWALRENGTSYAAWVGTDPAGDATLAQGCIFMNARAVAGTTEVSDTDIMDSNIPNTAAITPYDGGLFLHAGTELTVPKLLTNGLTYKGAGTLIIGQ